MKKSQDKVGDPPPPRPKGDTPHRGVYKLHIIYTEIILLCILFCEQYTVGWKADIGVKLKFWNFNFWVADIENTDYVGHGTAFIFFQLQKTSLLELSKVGQFCTFLQFHSKKANIWH